MNDCCGTSIGIKDTQCDPQFARVFCQNDSEETSKPKCERRTFGDIKLPALSLCVTQTSEALGHGEGTGCLACALVAVSDTNIRNPLGKRHQVSPDAESIPASKAVSDDAAPQVNDRILETPEHGKWWSRRYQMFSRFDEGIQMDSTGWYETTPEPVMKNIVNRINLKTIAMRSPLPPTETKEEAVIECPYLASLKVKDISDSSAQRRIVVDAGCGLGSSSICLAEYFPEVISLDIDPHKVHLAKQNANLYGVSDRVSFICEDFITWAQGLASAHRRTLQHEGNAEPSGPLADAGPLGECHCNLLPFEWTFVAPPWGGEDYKNIPVFSLSSHSNIGSAMLLAAMRISRNVATFLPRKQDISEIVSFAFSCGFSVVDVERIWTFGCMGCVIYLSKGVAALLQMPGASGESLQKAFEAQAAKLTEKKKLKNRKKKAAQRRKAQQSAESASPAESGSKFADLANSEESSAGQTRELTEFDEFSCDHDASEDGDGDEDNVLPIINLRHCSSPGIFPPRVFTIMEEEDTTEETCGRTEVEEEFHAGVALEEDESGRAEEEICGLTTDSVEPERRHSLAEEAVIDRWTEEEGSTGRDGGRFGTAVGPFRTLERDGASTTCSHLGYCCRSSSEDFSRLSSGFRSAEFLRSGIVNVIHQGAPVVLFPADQTARGIAAYRVGTAICNALEEEGALQRKRLMLIIQNLDLSTVFQILLRALVIYGEERCVDNPQRLRTKGGCFYKVLKEVSPETNRMLNKHHSECKRQRIAKSTVGNA